jgi:two-component system sensor histidine kinase and response regulator WspE
MTGDGGLGDSAMLDLFRAEIETHAPVLNEGLLALEKDPTQTKRLEALMRAAHSIKGAGRIVGVEAAVQVAHVLEDYFVAAQKGQVRLTSAAIDRLLSGVDVLTQIGQNADSQLAGWLAGAELSIRCVVEDLTSLRQGEPAPSPPPKAEEDQPPVGPCVVRPSGNLDAAEAKELRRSVRDLLDRGATHIRLDFSQVRTIAPAGLIVLADFARTANGHEPSATLEINGADAGLLALMRLTRLDRAYHLADATVSTAGRGS